MAFLYHDPWFGTTTWDKFVPGPVKHFWGRIDVQKGGAPGLEKIDVSVAVQSHRWAPNVFLKL